MSNKSPNKKSHSKSPRKKSISKSPSNKKISIDYILKHRDLKTIKNNYLTVAAYPNFFPVCFLNSKGKLDGLDVKLMQEFAKSVGLKLKFKIVHSFDKIWDLPRDNESDVSIGGIANSIGRGGVKTEWTIPYFYVLRSALSRKDDPINNFPQDVHGVLIGTYGSTGWKDGEIRLKKAHKQRLMISGKTDKDDVSKLLHGEVQGLMRGSFVSRAILKKHSKVLHVTEWEADKSFLPSDGEVFAFPTKLGSGIAVSLSTFLAEQIQNGYLKKLMKKYHLD